MFISVLDLYKIGIGPSSSHTVGPMVAALRFRQDAEKWLRVNNLPEKCRIRCVLKGSLAYTGKGHSTDIAVLLGLHGFSPEKLVGQNIPALTQHLKARTSLESDPAIAFAYALDIVFDYGPSLPQHPNGMIFSLVSEKNTELLSSTIFSIGGGFLANPDDIEQLSAPTRVDTAAHCPYPFDSANSMLEMSAQSGLSISAMKRANELTQLDDKELNIRLDLIWSAMCASIDAGLNSEGELPGGLGIRRRAKKLYQRILASSGEANVNDWLCAYALAVSEENGAGHTVVTAPTNGAAGVIPAILYYAVKHLHIDSPEIWDFLLTSSAIGGIIKHRSSISGAEVGCQGEVGSASAMAAAGLCAIQGGTAEQIEHAAEMALEHHLGMTCDPVQGLVQVPCIERNGFGAVKAFTAASLALLDDGEHFISLDNCIAAMKQTGLEMSDKYKETALGGLATSYTEC